MVGLLDFTNNLNRFYDEAGGKGSSFIPNLASAVDVTPRTIHKLLAGAEPSLALALKIARHLGFSLETGKGMAASPVPARQPTKAELALMVLESFNLEERQINVCRLALTAKPDLLKAMHDSLLRPAFEAIKGIAADHDDSSVG